MRYSTLFFSFILISITLCSCEELDVPEDTPRCVKKIIRKLKREEVRNPPATVWKWKVDGMTYYYVAPYCCDAMSQLYDTDCNRVCSPDGGFTGKGDGNCPSFEGTIESELIWEDDRK